MHEQSKIPTVRTLDGVYYRVVRDGNHVSRCFSDLSESEQNTHSVHSVVGITL